MAHTERGAAFEFAVGFVFGAVLLAALAFVCGAVLSVFGFDVAISSCVFLMSTYERRQPDGAVERGAYLSANILRYAAFAYFAWLMSSLVSQ